MVAIRTRYTGPTNTRGARMTADDSRGNRISISYPYGASDPHREAAEALILKMGWPNQIIDGEYGHDRYWVMLPRDTAHGRQCPNCHTADGECPACGAELVEVAK